MSNSSSGMRNIIPVSDLQRQAAQILSDVNESSEPIIITQRGRAAAVLLSAKRYAEIEEDLQAFDDLELEHLIEQGRLDKEAGNMISMEEVKKRLNYPA
jgi:prevent-host-death family protein